jgi:hypothetical protein
MISMHQVTLSERLPAQPAGEHARWRPATTVLPLSGVKSICVRLLADGAESGTVPGLALSRDGRTWLQPRRCIKVTGQGKAARPCHAYFVPAIRDMERIRSGPVQVRVGVFAQAAHPHSRTGITIFTLSDEGDATSFSNVGDHERLDCAQLAADIAQHRKMVAEMDALCKGPRPATVVEGQDGSEEGLEFDYCFLRDVAQRDLADAERAYRDKGCNPSD